MKKPRKILHFFIILLCVAIMMECGLRFLGHLYLKNLYVHTRADGGTFPNTVNVVCLGESSTAGIGVDKDHSYPAQLKSMLRKEYPAKNINVLVPPHVGQNTSQVANRINSYIDLYKPRVIILMVGYNNEWSLAESHISQFLGFDSPETIKIKLLILLNNSRLFKLTRYAYLKFFRKEKSRYVEGLESTKYIWGGPELARFPSKQWVYSFPPSKRDAFIKLWRHDVQKIISTSKNNNIKVLLMTYHINPTYLPTEEFIALADQEQVPLVRNDKTFKPLIEGGTIQNYIKYGKGWHPNEKGYNLIAQNAFQVIKKNKYLE